MTIGSSTDTKEEPSYSCVDIEFYDENVQLIDLSQHNAILAITHLTTGMVHLILKMTNLISVIEAKDSEGNTARGTWDPYSEEVRQGFPDGAERCCGGKADFGSAEVDINADNPLKVVSKKAAWVDNPSK